MKTYRLYSITMMNKIPQYNFINSVMANNIVKAEFLLEPSMHGEYIITVSKS